MMTASKLLFIAPVSATSIRWPAVKYARGLARAIARWYCGGGEGPLSAARQGREPGLDGDRQQAGLHGWISLGDCARIFDRRHVEDHHAAAVVEERAAHDDAALV